MFRYQHLLWRRANGKQSFHYESGHEMSYFLPFIFYKPSWKFYRNSLKWPSRWNLSPPDRHGFVSFPNPTDDALSHILEDPNTTEDSEVYFSTLIGGYNFQHTFNVSKPQICGLNVQNDTRCDDAKDLLFGPSTSVGQICSISEAVRPRDLITGTYSSEPVSMNHSAVCIDYSPIPVIFAHCLILLTFCFQMVRTTCQGRAALMM